MNAGTEGRNPSLRDAIEQLGDLVNRLSDRTGELGVALEEVLRPPEPDGCETAPAAPTTASSAHHRVRTIIERVEQIERQVIDLRGRVDV